jgi:DedD protein
LDEKLKQRLVGAAVLVALAIIFLPSLLHRDERIVIDTTSQIPTPPPVSKPISIPKPVKPEGIQASPPPEKLFQPEVVENTPPDTQSLNPQDDTEEKESSNKIAATVPAKTDAKTSAAIKTKPSAAIKPKAQEPKLNVAGLPIGWVIQVASLKTLESAKTLSKRLEKEDYRSYHRSVSTDKGQFFRVFIGPYIEQKRANEIKAAVDKAYKVNSRVLRFNPESGN